MLKYALRRALLALPLLWGVITIVFVLIELSPGSYADKFVGEDTSPELRDAVCAKYRCDAPGIVRYVALLGSLARLDFGRSMAGDSPVFDLVLQALPNTLVLSGVTLAIAWPLGMALGTLQAVRQSSRTDATISVTSLGLASMPTFWVAMMLQLLVSFYLGGWIQAHGGPALLALPSSGMTDPVSYEYLTAGAQVLDRARHLVLPVVAMGLAPTAAIARYMRSSMLEVIRQDFVRTARAKGLREPAVIVRHALRNALLPMLTMLGMSLPALFSGAVLVEMIFAWPGVGSLILRAVLSQDTPLVIACFFVSTCLVVAGNLAADLACAAADPRIRLDA